MALLVVQAALLLARLDLLPLWADEHFTLTTAEQPPGSIIQVLRADIHPPLYFVLAHEWLRLPWPGDVLEQLRAFSVFCALMSTVVVDRLWLRNLDSAVRLRFLLLWTFSPCLLLYARMARSYSLQLLLACVAFWFGARLIEEPRRRRWLLAYAGSAAVLLYTHYVPGLAVVGSMSLVALWRLLRHRDRAYLAPLLGANLLIGLVYAPWLAGMREALSTWKSHSSASEWSAAELFRQIAYWWVSFCFGEVLPLWTVVAGVVLSPLLVWMLWRTRRKMPGWFGLIAMAAVIGCLGVSRWVTYPFVPARLLFLLPFFLLLVAVASARPRAGILLFASLMVVDAAAIPSYFGRQDFLNKGYTAPFKEMAALINGDGGPGTLVILDSFNSDAAALPYLLRPGMRVMYLRFVGDADRIRRAAEDPATRTIWYVRNTHDLAPGRLNSVLEGELAAGYMVTRHEFQPYSRLDRWWIGLLDWPERPTHLYQVLEMHRRAENF